MKIIYSNKSINLIALIITLFIFIFFNFFNNKNIKQNEFSQKNNIQEEFQKENKENIIQEEIEEIQNWYIEIPSINLKAPIEETTQMEVLNKSIGHFEDTPKENGNIGLAAHNRGYEKNYFENLKNVKKGEEIIYKYSDFEKIYIVDTIEKIRATNWNYLENTKDNKITLITCVENEPDIRLCVQGTENKNNNKLPE